MNPSARTPCQCEYYRAAPGTHDQLLGIEQMTVPEACHLIAQILADEDAFYGDSKSLFSDPNDFVRFVGMHNWDDPLGMFLAGEMADVVQGQAWFYPQRHEARLTELRAS
jgi:hypothetical protein